jgi:hypothetical protein
MELRFRCDRVLFKERDIAVPEERAEDVCGIYCTMCMQHCTLNFQHYGNHRCSNGHEW